MIPALSYARLVTARASCALWLYTAACGGGDVTPPAAPIASAPIQAPAVQPVLDSVSLGALRRAEELGESPLLARVLESLEADGGPSSIATLKDALREVARGDALTAITSINQLRRDIRRHASAADAPMVGVAELYLDELERLIHSVRGEK